VLLRCAALRCVMETVALEDRDFLDSHPDRAEVAIAHIVKQTATAFYIVKTGTPDGREWAVSKRFSAFVDLRKALCNGAVNPAAKKVEAVPFPPKVRAPGWLFASRLAACD
jgi:hypothetical protein